MLVASEQESLSELLSQHSIDSESLSELISLIGSCIFRFVDHAPEDNQDVVYQVLLLLFFFFH